MPELDLSRYLDRIGLGRGSSSTSGSSSPPAPPPPPATIDGLRAIHEAHATQIPFENVDVLLGRPIRLDVPSLMAKLVDAKRGGYCFEQNMLLAAALETLGFAVTRLSARVRFRTPRKLARTHMLLRVEAGGESWIADAGFGGSGLLHPLRLQPDLEQRQYFRVLRLVRDDALWILQGRTGDDWEDYYAFTLEPQEMADFEMANHYVSTHPDSPFVQKLTVQLPRPDVRYVLRGRELAIERESGVEMRTVHDGELRGLLRDTLALDLPDDVVLPPLQ